MTAVIFDIDGTICDSTKVDDKCFMSAFKKVFGIDISNSDWSEFQNVTDWGISEEIILKEQSRYPTEQEYHNMISEFTRLLKYEAIKSKNQFKEIDGALEFIKLLKDDLGIAVGIATGSWKNSALIKLEAIGIDINEYAFSNCSHFKKREDILSDAIRQLNENHKNSIERIIYFGDGLWDFKTCKNLGIEFIGIDHHQNGILKIAGASIVFPDFKKSDIIIDQLKL